MELERHQRDAHSHHMPRFGRNRARPANHLFAALPSVSAPFASTSATTTTSTRDVALRDGRSGRGGRTGASGMDRNGIRLDADGWQVSLAPFRTSTVKWRASVRHAPSPAALSTWRFDMICDWSRWLQIFDDDLGTVREAEEVARRDGPIGGGAWGARGGDGMQEMFPALPTPAVPPRPQQLLPRAPPRINSAVLTATVTTKCLCGRRTKQIPMPAPGELPHAPLPCDPDCVRVARRQQLAAAFGQSDTGSCASAQVRACETCLGFLAGGTRRASLTRLVWLLQTNNEVVSHLGPAACEFRRRRRSSRACSAPRSRCPSGWSLWKRRWPALSVRTIPTHLSMLVAWVDAHDILFTNYSCEPYWAKA
jgi:hypothetical protein